MAIPRENDTRSPEADQWLKDLQERFTHASAWDDHPTVDEQLAEHIERLGLEP